MRGNGALCRGRPAWLLGVLAAGVLWLAPASASAALVWSAPVFLNAGADSGLVDLACPTSTLCVAVDSAGREVSFDPADPSAWSAYAIDRTRALTGVACPAASECVAVDGQGAAITFDPEQAGSASRRYVISRGPLQVPAPGNALAAVSCASTGLCIAVDQQGHVIGFSPVGPPDARIAPFSAEQTLGGQHLVACPASTQCSVLSDTGTGTAPRSPTQTLITFDPRSLAAVATIAVPSSVSLTQLVCPTMSECIGAGSSLSVVGGQLAGNGTATVTFDPTSSTAGPAVVRGEVGNVALSCASASVCTAMDASGAEVSFDPNGSGVLEQAAVDPLGDYPKGFNGARIACPSADECVLATWNDSDAITFAPLSPGTPVPVPIDDGGPIAAVACPAPGECVGVANTQFAYVPETTSLAALFDSRSQTHLDATGLLSGTAKGIACPTRTQCTVVATQTPVCGGCSTTPNTAETTFNPYKPPRRYAFGSSGIKIDKTTVGGLACPSARECTVVDKRGREVTFDPIRPRARSVQLESNTALTSIGCPSAKQCTAVGKSGVEVTFVPETGSLITKRQIDKTRTLTSVACPTARQCSAVDRFGREITFDPQRDRRLVSQRISTTRLTGIACPSQRSCVAVTAAGDAALGDPVTRHRWTVEAVRGASSLLAIACSSPEACVAADSAGHMFETVRQRNRHFRHRVASGFDQAIRLPSWKGRLRVSEQRGMIARDGSLSTPCAGRSAPRSRRWARRRRRQGTTSGASRSRLRLRRDRNRVHRLCLRQRRRRHQVCPPCGTCCAAY